MEQVSELIEGQGETIQAASWILSFSDHDSALKKKPLVQAFLGMSERQNKL